MKRNSTISYRTQGFTLAELLVALVVTGIVLSAVATLAYALNSASQTGSDVASTQAQLRQGTVRILEVVRDSRMILTASDTELAIWKSDDNEDGRINVNELVFLDCAPTHNTLRLAQFSSVDNPEVTLISGSLSLSQADLMNGHGGAYLLLLPECVNVKFVCDAGPPLTRRVTISFELAEDNAVHEYEIDATLRAWAGHLLNDTADGLVTEDDDE